MQHLKDLIDVFTTLRKYNLPLNPEKCVFRVDGGTFLKFMLTQREIEANLEKCKAIIHMQIPKHIKEIKEIILK